MAGVRRPSDRRPRVTHAHALLARGQRELEKLFPGIERALVAVWGLGAGADVIWPKLLQPYMEMMIESVHHDPAVLRAMSSRQDALAPS